ncbi:MAG: hypothetical protein C4298_08540 [Thermus sp.]
MRAIEESPETFFDRFRALAVEAHLYPAPWGFPLLLAKATPSQRGPSEALFLYALDRGPPPAPTGRVQALFHGLVQEVFPYQRDLLHREGSRYRAAWRKGFMWWRWAYPFWSTRKPLFLRRPSSSFSHP